MNNHNETHHEYHENGQCECHDEHRLEQEHHHHKHKSITITTHDRSIVGSYKFSIEKPYKEGEAILDDLLKQVAKEVADLGGIIGHIKAFFTSKGKEFMISITENESTKRYIETSLCHVEGVAIVFCIEPEQLEDILIKAFRRYIKE